MQYRLDEMARLIHRYRTLCEANGIARAKGIPLAAQVQAELSDLEQKLLACAGEPSQNRTADVGPRKPVGRLDADRAPIAPRSKASEAADEATLAVGAAPPEEAVIFTDGAAQGNPGPGGYCALVRLPGRPDRELSGGTLHTTNNKMELTAAIVGLRAAIDAGVKTIAVYSDSEYLVKGMTKWLSGWQRKNWKTADGQPVKNQDLWQQLAELTRGRDVRWEWIRGHVGHPENERCDQVATAAARRVAQSRSA